MKPTREEIFHLLDSYTSGQISPGEELLLFEWLANGEETMALRDYIFEDLRHNRTVQHARDIDWLAMYRRIMGPHQNEHQEDGVTDRPPAAKKKLRYLTAFKLVAAVIVLAIGISVCFKWIKNQEQPIHIVDSVANDIAAPSVVKSVLTLSDGQKIQLGSAPSGLLATQGQIQIVKDQTDGISYAGTSKIVSNNQLTVPKGSLPVKLVLSDGSKIWLNVGSSLRYPTAFVGHERKVELEGEAYFEIAHNASKPFIVQKGDISVRVLGTHFDVNGYEDERVAKVTLLEGSVKVLKGNNEVTIKPGEQARITNKIKVAQGVDLDEVMAWRAGKFKFGQQADIGGIMRQISKWYNVDIQYEGKAKTQFWGVISRKATVSEVLKILEATGGVKFNLDGNTITVRPGK